MSKKSYESKIGKIIYGALLFMPLLSIGVRSLYVVCNKNAYQSYSGAVAVEGENDITSIYPYSSYTRTNETNGILWTNETRLNGTWFSNNLQINYSNGYVEQYYVNVNSFYVNNEEIIGVKSFSIGRINTISATNQRIYLRLYDKTLDIDNYKFNRSNMDINPYDLSTDTYLSPINSYDITNNQYNITFEISTYTLFGQATYSLTNETYIKYLGQFLKQSLIIDRDLSNVFEYSISQVEENSLYNWSKNTAIYEGVETTTNLLGITHSFYPMLLTYWLLITIIYIIYDIALIIVLLAHKKVHSLIEKD